MGPALLRARTAAVQQKVADRAAESKGPEEAWTIVAAVGPTLVGLAVYVAGADLYIGNTTGQHPTFPYAGCITSNIGGFVLVVGLVALKEWFTGPS